MKNHFAWVFLLFLTSCATTPRFTVSRMVDACDQNSRNFVESVTCMKQVMAHPDVPSGAKESPNVQYFMAYASALASRVSSGRMSDEDGKFELRSLLFRFQRQQAVAEGAAYEAIARALNPPQPARSRQSITCTRTSNITVTCD
jgi:hypothetical protein